MSTAIKNIRQLGFQWETLDPFLFCVHHEDFYPNGNANYGPDPALLAGRNIGQDFQVKDGWRMYHGQNVPGFPGHPHRGFETVTVVQKGLIDHSDSHGASGRYGGGDTQWMTAGSGLQHSEMFPLLHQDKANDLELFQIWLNLPKKNKMVDASFKMLWADDIPIVEHQDSNNLKTSTTLIAGSLDNQKAPSPTEHSWAADPENHVAIWIINMQANAEWTLPKSIAGLSRSLYFFKGESITVENTKLPVYHGLDLNSDMDLKVINGNKDSKFLLLQAKPINEPVAQYGPFVMNTEEEIRQAFTDYRSTEFGGWPWPSNDPVHGPYQGRFAKFADGSEEIPK